MSSTAVLAAHPLGPQVRPSDRLSLTVFLALVVHAILILGVSFAPSNTPRISRDTMEIILVPTRSEKTPDDPKYLAQANQEGGGESEKHERPVTPMTPPLTAEQAVVPAGAPPVAPPEPAAEPEPAPKSELTRLEATNEAPAPPVQQQRPAPQPKQRPKPRSEPRPKPPVPERLTAAALVSRSLEIASLDAEVNRKLTAYAERPRHRFVNARTKQYKYAAYMEAWRAKVERVGNLNYPDEARRRRLSGTLLLDVALRPDGSIHDIVLRRSSGHKVLDDAAIRIVKLAAPFAPFPKDIRKETDILHVERTWQFVSSNRFFAE
jgi:protein TonB